MLTTIPKTTAVETRDGAGVRIRRLFPSPKVRAYDPFVLFDEFFLEPSAGFPLHPHAGFEAVTYILEGGFHHTDTMGNDTTICDGGVQYFSAGRGIEHSEMPGTEGMNHGVQIWVNLPRSLKEMNPSYHQVEPQQIPTYEDDTAFVRTVIGGKSPVRLHTIVFLLDVVLKAEKTYQYRIPEGFSGLVYPVAGDVRIEGEPFAPGETYFLDRYQQADICAHVHSRFLLLSGQPLNQPIRLHGSFVD